MDLPVSGSESSSSRSIGLGLKTSSSVCPTSNESVRYPLSVVVLPTVLGGRIPLALHHNQCSPEKGSKIESWAPQSTSESKNAFIWLGMTS